MIVLSARSGDRWDMNYSLRDIQLYAGTTLASTKSAYVHLVACRSSSGTWAPALAYKP